MRNVLHLTFRFKAIKNSMAKSKVATHCFGMRSLRFQSNYVGLRKPIDAVKLTHAETACGNEPLSLHWMRTRCRKIQTYFLKDLKSQKIKIDQERLKRQSYK